MIFPLNGTHKIHRIHYLGQFNTINDSDISELHLILKLKATTHFIGIYLIMYMLVFIPTGTEMSYCFKDNAKGKLEGGEVTQ